MTITRKQLLDAREETLKGLAEAKEKLNENLTAWEREDTEYTLSSLHIKFVKIQNLLNDVS